MIFAAARAYVLAFGGLLILTTLAGATAWLLPASSTGPFRDSLLADGPGRVPSRRELPALVVLHFHAYNQRRPRPLRLAMLATLPWTFAETTLGRVLPWHVTLTTGNALAMVTQLPGRPGWVFHNFARCPGRVHRSAGRPLLQQVITAAGGKPLRLNAANLMLAEHYARYGFRSQPAPHARRRMVHDVGSARCDRQS